jgi:hypothetical protein
LRSAWEHESGRDIAENVVKDVGRLRVWWSSADDDYSDRFSLSSNCGIVQYPLA